MPAPAWNDRLAVVDRDGADGDAGVEVPVEAQVAHGAGVEPPPLRLQLADDLHGPHLGRTGDRPRGEAGAEQVEGGLPPRHLGLDVGDDVHDVGIALDGHELVHLHRAHPGHPADVVASEVHQHDVLGALLRVGQQVLLQLPLFLRVAAPGPGAGDGPKLDVLAGEADEDLRGGADDLEVVQLQEEHVGRRVGEPQGAVDLERLDLRARLQPLGQHHLDDVAGGDVLLALAHHGVELLRRDVGLVSDGRSRTAEAPGLQGLGRLPQG